MGGAVAEAGVGTVVLGLDVAGDVLSRVFDGFPLGAPGAAFLELAEPGLDESLRFRVAVNRPRSGDWLEVQGEWTGASAEEVSERAS